MASIHIPADWSDAAEHILSGDFRRILVIGSADAGKSTFCRFLREQALQAGRRVALLDTDVGQKMLGPPACLTTAEPTRSRLLFVGTTNPVLGWTRLIVGSRYLAGTMDADLLIANTSGLLAGPGRRLKAGKIAALAPDLLVALGDDPKLEEIMRDHPGLPALRLTRSPEAKRKTNGERRAARREAFRWYFTEASVLEFEQDALRSIARHYPAGLLVGFPDGQGGDAGLGILAEPSSMGTVRILTPVAPHLIRAITPGSICTDQNFSDFPVQPET
jgi:polynucleotide 5'-hydroxyl-kinase GRC3/NOL9